MDRRSLLFVIALMGALFFVNQWFSSKSTPPQSSSQPQKSVNPFQETLNQDDYASPPPATLKLSQEEFFVLENEYQQIVFSNRGGCIAEINLPFQSKDNPKSYVRPIHTDRLFLEDYSFDDHFPSFPYYVNNGAEVRKVEDCQLGGYYPLLRRTLFNPTQEPYVRSPTKHYALKVVSDYVD
jgi:hypothetical protein